MADLDFSDVHLLVAGDVCEDVIVAGPARRLSRETAALPVIDVELDWHVDGCAAAAFRQGRALGAHAFLLPTGRPCSKSRLFAVQEGVSREVARWDSAWPLQDASMFREMMREIKGDVLLYSQNRSERPLDGIMRELRRFRGLRLADARHPAYFAGLDIVKVGLDDAWAALRPPRPLRTPERAAQAAAAFAREYGYRMAIVTMGADGYAAYVDGAEVLGQGLRGGRRTSGAGDVFVATLACALGSKMEAREALELANVAAGLACRKDEHLSTITTEEVQDGLRELQRGQDR